MSNFKPPYVDTDSATKDAYAKQVLSSLYGTVSQGEKCMNRDYISVIADGKPTVMFKRNIVAVYKNGDYTRIICIGDIEFDTKEDYASVVKKIIG